MPIFSSLPFYCISRYLLWFDSTLPCLMLVSFFYIWPQFECQIKRNQLNETSASCGFCLPQVICIIVEVNSCVLSLILSLFSYSPANSSLQIFSTSFLIVDMCKSELKESHENGTHSICASKAFSDSWAFHLLNMLIHSLSFVPTFLWRESREQQP